MDRLNENITLDNLYLFRFRVCAKLPIQKDLPNKNNFMDNNFLQKKSLIFHNRIFHKTIIVLIFIRGQSLLINANDPNGQLAPSKPLSRLIHSSSRRSKLLEMPPKAATDFAHPPSWKTTKPTSSLSRRKRRRRRRHRPLSFFLLFSNFHYPRYNFFFF